jgi:hypothetical protein
MYQRSPFCLTIHEMLWCQNEKTAPQRGAAGTLTSCILHQLLDVSRSRCCSAPVCATRQQSGNDGQAAHAKRATRRPFGFELAEHKLYGGEVTDVRPGFDMCPRWYGAHWRRARAQQIAVHQHPASAATSVTASKRHGQLSIARAEYIEQRRFPGHVNAEFLVINHQLQLHANPRTRPAQRAQITRDSQL